MGYKHKKKRPEKYGFTFWFNLFDGQELVSHKALRADVEATGVAKANHIISDAVKIGYLDKCELENQYSLNSEMKENFINSGEKLVPRVFKP